MASEFLSEVQTESKKPRLDEELKLKETESRKARSDEELNLKDVKEGGYGSDDYDMSPEEYQHYVDVVRQSRGFDVPEDSKPMDCGIDPVVNLFSDWAYYVEVDQCAESALEEHNRATGKKYVVHKLVKVNMYPCAGTVYYITFVAEDLTEVCESENGISAEGGGGGESEKKVGPLV